MRVTEAWTPARVARALALALGCALAGTHKIPLSRAFLVALVPAGVPIVLLTARALLVLEELPGWEPSSPYFVP